MNLSLIHSCIIKATVQAAVAAVPLAAGLECGPIVLSVAVLAILITAPLGSIGMDAGYKKLLEAGDRTQIYQTDSL